MLKDFTMTNNLTEPIKSYGNNLGVVPHPIEAIVQGKLLTAIFAPEPLNLSSSIIPKASTEYGRRATVQAVLRLFRYGKT